MKPRTSKETQALILWAYEHNVRVAKSPAMKKFAQTRLDDYLAEMARRNEPPKANAMSRFVDKLECSPEKSQAGEKTGAKRGSNPDSIAIQRLGPNAGLASSRSNPTALS